MKIQFVALGLLAFSGLTWSVQADIAPTRFTGSGIVARSETAIRMQRAVVDIGWGMPCELTATFEMVNSSGTSIDMRMGFPMPAGEFESRPSTVSDDLTITFDGVPAEVTPPGGGTEDRDNRRDWAWYHCQHTFKPGTTTVVVNALLRASLDSGRAFHESLYYCIETGRNWAGTIGEEVVTIRFPHPIAKEQIAVASPAGYKIEGDSVRWHFKDFKPTGQTHDIAITYLRPDAMKVLSALRQDAARAPDSSAAAVKLAKHLLVLGYAKSNAGFLPRRLTR